MLIFPILFWIGVRVYDTIQFDRKCADHIKRAADANTIDLAIQEMKTVVVYLEANDIKTGYTSVLYTTPDEDVGYWYNNLTSALGELEKVTPETTQLTRSNLLLKLRETLLDHSSSGETVTLPSGVTIFPNNVAFCWWGWISTMLLIIGLILSLMSLNSDRY
jgi:hypothetical protein